MSPLWFKSMQKPFHCRKIQKKDIINSKNKNYNREICNHFRRGGLSLDRALGGHHHVSVTKSGQPQWTLVQSRVGSKGKKKTTPPRPEPATPYVCAVERSEPASRINIRPPCTTTLDSLRDHRRMSSRLDQEPRFGSPQNVASLHEFELTSDPSWCHLMLRVRCCRFMDGPSRGQPRDCQLAEKARPGHLCVGPEVRARRHW